MGRWPRRPSGIQQLESERKKVRKCEFFDSREKSRATFPLVRFFFSEIRFWISQNKLGMFFQTGKSPGSKVVRTNSEPFTGPRIEKLENASFVDNRKSLKLHFLCVRLFLKSAFGSHRVKLGIFF